MLYEEKKHLKYHINIFVNLDSSPFVTINKEDDRTSDGTQQMKGRVSTTPWGNKVLVG